MGYLDQLREEVIADEPVIFRDAEAPPGTAEGGASGVIGYTGV